MHKGRLEAFSDGVLAIIITIMVLDLRAPRNAGLADLRPLVPLLLGYALSFVYVGIYWNNHHHMFQATQRVTGPILWANLHLLFWLSLIPFVTSWMDGSHFAKVPTAIYGVVLILSAFAYTILQNAILKTPGGNALLAAAVGRDWKGKISIALYAVAIGASFVSPLAANGFYVLVALIWLVPDRRIEKRLMKERGE